MSPRNPPRTPGPGGPRLGAVTALLCSVALLGAACTDDGDPPPLGLGDGALGLRTGLECTELVEATRAQFETVRTAAAPFGAADARVGVDAVEMAEESAAPLAATGADDAGGEVVAGTNVQEAGVDEGDIIKTDGRRIVTLTDGTLRVTVLDGSPVVDGALDLGGNDAGSGEIFLRGDEVVVLMPVWGGSVGGGVPPGPAPDDPVTFDDPVAQDGPTTPDVPVPFESGVRILRIDISDPAGPTVVEESTVEGSLVSTRMADGTVRAVLRSPMPVMTELWAATDEQEVETIIDDLEPADMLPRATDGEDVTSLGGCGDVALMPALSDDDATELAAVGTYPAEPATVTVLSIGDSLAALAPVTVSGSADVVYASPSSLYVTSTGWGDQGPVTFVHRFDTTDPGPADYTGSGAVPGTPLNQYSLSERDGLLRIVTTTEDPTAFVEPVLPEVGMDPGLLEDDSVEDSPVEGGATGGGAPGEAPAVDLPGVDLPTDEPAPEEVPAEEPRVEEPPTREEPVEPDTPVEDLPIEEELIAPEPFVPPTEGRLAVLSPDDTGALVEVGSIEDLGVGEAVQSVRFVEDMAYVVTFRRTDPLYAIDLSDPSDPRALGELKITGFSEYLHPIGDGLLLGIGREATEQGRDIGFKASLFDVSDPTNPTEVDKWVVPDAYTTVGHDPHAFTWDPVAGHAVFPLERHDRIAISPECPPGADCPAVEIAASAASAVVLSAGPEGLAEMAELSHAADGTDPWLNAIQRSVVVDRDLWTLSPAGLGLSNADSPTDVTLVAF